MGTRGQGKSGHFGKNCIKYRNLFQNVHKRNVPIGTKEGKVVRKEFIICLIIIIMIFLGNFLTKKYARRFRKRNIINVR